MEKIIRDIMERHICGMLEDMEDNEIPVDNFTIKVEVSDGFGTSITAELK